MPSRKLTLSLTAGVAAIAAGAGSYGIVSAASGGGSAAAGGGSTGGTGSGPHARSGPAAGGSAGTVSSTSAAGFTLTTSTGQRVTVTEASSTTYQQGGSTAPASAVTPGEDVLVLGTTQGTAITATQVIVRPAGGGSAASQAAVVPFKRGTHTSKQAGQIPAAYRQGSGTIVGGTAAAKATEAALAAYPGGVVDRVVKLRNGEYEVHNIGVNWPHHIFVSQAFTVVGAE